MAGIRRTLVGLLATSALVLAFPALAQDQSVQPQTAAPEQRGSVDAIEDIVVTAQRRQESLQDVPIAISVFTQADMDSRNIQTALDLVQYVPNFVGHSNTGLATANAYYIRGVGDTESLATKDPPVGTYVDDLFFSRQSANNFAFFDVDRIEVLRGPQGTLFGRNTTGGAINVVIQKPNDRLGGSAEAGFGKFHTVMVRGSINVPISNSLFAKASAYFNDDNGYVRNVTTKERLNDERGYGGRLALRALAGPLTWDGAFTYMHAAGSNLINFECNPINPTQCDGRYASTGLRKDNQGQNQYPTISVANGKGSLPLGNVTNSYIAASNFEFDFGEAATLNFISGYIRTKQSYNLDFFDGRAAPAFVFANDPSTGRPSADGNISAGTTPGGPPLGVAGGFAIAAKTDSEQFTQEIKVTGRLFDGAIDYVGGLYYYHERNVSDFADIITNTVTRNNLLLADRIVDNETEAYAGYLQADFNATDWLKLTAGVRYTDEQKNYEFSDNRAQCAVTPLPGNCIDGRNFAAVDIDLNPATPPVSIPRGQRIKIWTPRFVVNVKPNDDMLFFASATRGFKSGGQSGRATSVRFLLPFEPETVWSYEVGSRLDLLDKRLRFNLTGFYAKTTNLQGGSAFITTNNITGAQTLNFVTRNFADFRNQGIEFEIVAVPVKGLTLNLSGGTQDAKYLLDPGRVDVYGTLSATAQQGECVAALAGSASPRGDTRAATARAQSSCGNGVVTPNGDIATPPRAPKFNIAAGASYEIGTGKLRITPSANVLYTSSQEVGSSNTSFYRDGAGVVNVRGEGEFFTGSFSRARTVVNAAIGVSDEDGNWRLSVECSNCFNVSYPQATLSNFTYLNQPASWMARVRYKW